MFNFELSTQLLEVVNVIFFVHVAINAGIVILMLASMLIYSVINKSFNWKNNKGLDYLFDLFIAANIILTGTYAFGILLEIPLVNLLLLIVAGSAIIIGCIALFIGVLIDIIKFSSKGDE